MQPILLVVTSLVLMASHGLADPHMEYLDSLRVLEILETFGLNKGSKPEEVHQILTDLASKSTAQVYGQWPAPTGCLSWMRSESAVKKSKCKATKNLDYVMKNVKELSNECEISLDACRSAKELPITYFDSKPKKTLEGAFCGYLQDRDRKLIEFCRSNIERALEPTFEELNNKENIGSLLELVSFANTDSRPSYTKILELYWKFRIKQLTGDAEVPNYIILTKLEQNFIIFDKYLNRWAEGAATRVATDNDKLKKLHFAYLIWYRVVATPEMVNLVDNYYQQLEEDDTKKLANYISETYHEENYRMRISALAPFKSHRMLLQEILDKAKMKFANRDELLQKICHPEDEELNSAISLMWIFQNWIDEHKRHFSVPIAELCGVRFKWTK